MSKMGPPKILLLDYYSEKNRGDAAIQVGLIRLVRSQFPEAIISVVSAIGANQSRDFSEHFSQTNKENISILGGLCLTSVPRGERSRRTPKLLRAIRATSSFVFCVILLALLIIRVPAGILAAALPGTFATTLRALAKADLIVWRGTNFRNGTSATRDIYSTFFWCFQPAVCLALGKPVACAGVSLWEPRTAISEYMYQAVFRRCIFVASREEESLGRIRAILGEQGPSPVLMPDLSFILLKEETKFARSLTRGTTVGVTIVDRHKGDWQGRMRYLRVMNSIFDEILADPAVSIVIIPQATTQSEDASGIVDDILAARSSSERARIVVGRGERTIQELVREYARLKYMVATRLHSSVFALASGTPVFVMRYDKGPQWNILSMLGAGAFVVDYRTVDEHSIEERFRSFIADTYPSDDILKKFARHHDHINDVFMGAREAYERWLIRKK